MAAGTWELPKQSQPKLHVDIGHSQYWQSLPPPHPPMKQAPELTILE